MKNVYSVGQVNSYIKNMFTQDFVLNRLYIKGEISNCKYHTSGHIYFSLKDETGTIACVMFASYRRGLAFRMENGQTVIVAGSVNVYERDGKYQIYAKEVLLDGAGILYQKFEALKKELAEMGMFAAEYKQPIPRYASKIGIITAPTGAAIRDIMNIANRRNPYVQLILYPALVQGDGAAASICRGFKVLEKAGVDVIIAGRGGGSIEDLWAFNEESVARAAFDCQVPVISAVGHETDTTIIDFVADLRAPTPSAAAELAIYEYRVFREDLAGTQQYIEKQIRLKIDETRQQIQHLGMRLNYLSPQNQLREKRQLAADLQEELTDAMEQRIREARHQMELYIEKLNGLSPLLKLQKGYSYVAAADGQPITRTGQVQQGDKLLIHVTDGVITGQVTQTETRERRTQ